MLAAHIASGAISLIETPRPRLRKGFSLLRLRLAGICNTDIELLRGYYGFAGIPGHEFVADVVASSDPNLTGKRVVGEINLACGHCADCRSGFGRHCLKRTVLGILGHPGAFAEYLTLPTANLFPLPHSIPDEHAVFTEPIAAACEILDQVRFPRGARVAVLGDGKLGLLIAQVLHIHGCDTTLLGRNASKLAPLPLPTRLLDRHQPSLPAAAFTHVVDATGSAEGLQSALTLVRPRGTIILKSTVNDRFPIDMARVIVNEISLIGSRCGRFAPALRLLRSRRLILNPMIHAQYPLARAPEAFAHAQSPRVLKVLLTP